MIKHSFSCIKIVLIPRGKLACTDFLSGAIRVAFRYLIKIKQKGATVACAGLRLDSYLCERPRTKTKRWHSANIQINSPAIVRVYQSNLAIVQVYSNNITQRCWIQNKTACILAGYTLLTRLLTTVLLKPDWFILNCEQIWVLA